MIQISSRGSQRWFPEPIHKFTEVRRFLFDDIDHEASNAINEYQAEELVSVLQKALAAGQDVVVHCTAGICRSGAVVEVGTMMGLEDPGKYRQPNVRVKTMMMRVLGLTYD